MIDLHMHSIYSEDGEFTPAELVKQCSEREIRIMAVTDHNCAKANAEAKVEASTKGIVYIPGIEIDCVYQDTNFHVLGYGIDFQSKDFEIIESNIRKQGFQASLDRLAKHRQWAFMWQKTICGQYLRAVIGRRYGRERCLQRFYWQSRNMRIIYCCVLIAPEDQEAITHMLIFIGTITHRENHAMQK